MKFIIHYNGKYEDQVFIEGETIEELREIAKRETTIRCWEEANCWSEKVAE
jgi:hypothetical protein